MTTEEEKVWGVFVGDEGDQLETFNTMTGPFPPEPGTDGYIAIGWPAVGDMRLYTDNYADYVEKFRIVYQNQKKDERVLKTKANMLWNFSFKMKEGDWIISPSSTAKFLLAGKIQGEYIPKFHENKSLPKGRVDFVHLRKVKWLYAVAQKDPRYAKLHRIGMLTVVQPNISSSDLQAILNGQA
jgi:predicted Mrr-cat superfamily restriction endonuclease